MLKLHFFNFVYHSLMWHIFITYITTVSIEIEQIIYEHPMSDCLYYCSDCFAL